MNDPVMIAAGFLNSHPDLRHRLRGLELHASQDYYRAYEQFKEAAWYSDKPSQAVVAEMLWEGKGVPMNRALGYVWMDLAAERGYDRFVLLRDRFWNALTPSERQRVASEGPAIKAQYADAVAGRRLARILRTERSKMTGSRVGSMASNVQIIIPGHGTIDGTQFYNPRYWDPKQYRAWHDEAWIAPREGRVNVGEIETVRDGKQPAARPEEKEHDPGAREQPPAADPVQFRPGI